MQVDSREDVSDLLSLEGKIDLVISRGGNELVKSIMEGANGNIPVLGHTEGVCHVYVDQHANIQKAVRIGGSAVRYLMFPSFWKHLCSIIILL